MTESNGASMRAYHGSPAVKAELVARMNAHRAAGRISQYEYWDMDEESGEWRGSAIGCAIEASDYNLAQEFLGIPEPLAQAQDRIFERLPAKEAADFAVAFFETIPVGGDLWRATHKFMAWLLSPDGVMRQALTTDAAPRRVRDAVAGVQCLFARCGETGVMPPVEEWAAAAEEARAAWAATLPPPFYLPAPRAAALAASLAAEASLALLTGKPSPASLAWAMAEAVNAAIEGARASMYAAQARMRAAMHASGVPAPTAEARANMWAGADKVEAAARRIIAARFIQVIAAAYIDERA